MRIVATFLVVSVLSVQALAQQSEPPKQEAAQAAPPAVQQEAVVGQRMIMATASEDGGAPQVQFYSSDGQMGNMVLSTTPVPWGGSNSMSLMHNGSVQKELDLVDDQIKQIKEMQQSYSEKMNSALTDMTSNGFSPKSSAQLKQMLEDMKTEQKQRMEDILLPHQLDRLKQIALQVQMQQSGETATLTSSKVAEELGISKEQKKQIEKRAAEIKRDLEEKIKRLKEQAKEELMEELSSDQREKLEEMTGDKFELKQVNWSDRLKEMRSRRAKANDDEK